MKLAYGVSDPHFAASGVYKTPRWEAYWSVCWIMSAQWVQICLNCPRIIDTPITDDPIQTRRDIVLVSHCVDYLTWHGQTDFYSFWHPMEIKFDSHVQKYRFGHETVFPWGCIRNSIPRKIEFQFFSSGQKFLAKRSQVQTPHLHALIIMEDSVFWLTTAFLVGRATDSVSV